MLQILLFRAWLNGRYPQQAKSLAPIIEELQVVQQQRNELVEATRREFVRLVLRLHELDGKLDGLCNDLKILRQSVATAAFARSRKNARLPGGLMIPHEHFSKWGWLYAIFVLLSLTFLASWTILTAGTAYLVLAILVVVPLYLFASFIHWLWSNS